MSDHIDGMNRIGSHISNRRSVSLIGCWPHDGERYLLHGERGQSRGRHECLAVGPAFEREAFGQETQGSTFSSSVREANADHGSIVSRRWTLRRIRWGVDRVL